MKNTIFNSAISEEAVRELEQITHYTEYRLSVMGRIADKIGYVLGATICITPFIFGIIANINGIV